MAYPNLVARPLRSTPAGAKSKAGLCDVPLDLLHQASQRLGIMSVLGAGLWIFGSVLYHWSTRAIHGRWDRLGFPDAIAAASALLSVGLFVYTRKTSKDPQFVLDLGLFYLVVTSFALGVVMHWESIPTGEVLRPTVSWIGPVLLMFAAIVPTAPRKMLFTSLLAACADPIGMWLGQARGVYDVGPVTVLLVHFSTYLMAGAAVLISGIVTSLGREVHTARDLGSYHLNELLGRGGMGEVYKATHRMLARPAAIKLIRPEVIAAGDSEAARTAVKRFRREAEAAASLRSPHTVGLYDFGVTDSGTLYFVMELLEGLDLESLVRKHGPVPASRVVYIILQVCESLEEAHGRGLIHRDIKPANIHLGRLGVRCDFVKVLDFGLVKSTIGPLDENSLATAAGALTPGTPAYMAPEMALGEQIDGRADLYALGCVAYYLLTAQLVFEGTSAVQVIAKHLHEEPVSPSQRGGVEIPMALERVVLACLAKRPNDRPQNAHELARRLEEVAPSEPWTRERALSWWSANDPTS
jgi:serine/threonine-protein kinase